MALYDQVISDEDEISFNRDLWRPINDIPDLRAYFWAVWRKAQRGALPRRQQTIIDTGGETDEFDDEAPTRVTVAAIARPVVPRLVVPPLPPLPEPVVEAPEPAVDTLVPVSGPTRVPRSSAQRWPLWPLLASAMVLGSMAVMLLA